MAEIPSSPESVKHSGPFSMLPRFLILDSRLPAFATCLWSAVDMRNGGRSELRVSVPCLAADMGCSRDSITRGLGVLADRGLITAIAVGGKGALYRIRIRTINHPLRGHR